MQITGYFLLSNSILHSNEYIVRTLIISARNAAAC